VSSSDAVSAYRSAIAVNRGVGSVGVGAGSFAGFGESSGSSSSLRRDVKGLRNTPRYEPYVSRKFRKTTTTTTGIAIPDTSTSTTTNTPLAHGQTNIKNEILNSSTHVPLSQKSLLTQFTENSSGSHDVAYMTSTSEMTSATEMSSAKTGHVDVGVNEVSLDFLRGVLSEELDLIGENLFGGGMTSGGAGRPGDDEDEEDDSDSDGDDAPIVVDQDADMKKIMELFED